MPMQMKAGHTHSAETREKMRASHLGFKWPAEQLAKREATRKAKAPTLEQRFFARAEPIPEGTGCWEWTGKRSNGYGELRIDGKPTKAHHVSYEIHFGPIPKGLFACHKCDNPGCVSPYHLFLGTNADNVADAVAKNRMHRGREPICIEHGPKRESTQRGGRYAKFVCNACENAKRKARHARSH